MCLLSAICYAFESLLCRGAKNVDNIALTHYFHFWSLLVFSWYKNFEYVKTLDLLAFNDKSKYFRFIGVSIFIKLSFKS